VYAPSLKSTDLASPGYYFLATDTPEFMRWLAGQAEDAGAQILCGAEFTGAERIGDGPDGRFRLAKPALETAYLIGADGARSAVADHFSLGRNRRFLVGLEMEYDQVGGVTEDLLHTFFDSRIAPGYIGWVVPGAGVVQVGLACKRADKPNLRHFLERLGGVFDFSKSEVVERRSGVIPCGGVVRPVAAPGVLLIGDAAGMVSPMTAGGIFTAFHYGERAAAAVADYLDGSGPEPGTVLPPTYPKFTIKKWLRRALDLGPPNWLLNLMIGTPPMQALARLVYFHSKGLGSGAAWRDLLGFHRPGPRDG
ncbi:MAG: FAD-dependent monooxygenase, partial [Pseudomonadota bacterium]